MKKLTNHVVEYLSDLYYVLRRYVINLAHAVLGLTERKYHELRRDLTLDIVMLIEENTELRNQVEALTKKTVKKSAAVAKKSPAKKKTSGK